MQNTILHLDISQEDFVGLIQMTQKQVLTWLTSSIVYGQAIVLRGQRTPAWSKLRSTRA